ncbi:MAG: type II toxin-antitoxin system Phd/YefM family antitoxin [Candidatus Poribacteria bacterium]|nr:type II toxin-antitoxin system Phd/YefM family antitoxin [Candidatus Poribacteria bacterium]
MKEYSFTEARQNFASILDEAKQTGVVCIRKRDGDTFFVKPATTEKSPLDITGVDLKSDRDDIVDSVRESRTRVG